MKINGKIKASYIAGILPEKIKSIIYKYLSPNDTKKINQAAPQIKKLSQREQIGILDEYIRKIKLMREKKSGILDDSLIFSLVLLSLLVLGSFVYSRIKFESSVKIIYFIEQVLMNGGMHIVVLPYIWGVIRADYKISPLRILTESKNLMYDFFAAAAAAPAIALLITSSSPVEKLPINTFFYCMTFFTALIIGPAVEELFFRFFMFYKAGSRYGYIFCGFFSSLLFAAVHIPESMALLICYIISGGILCSIYYIRKSLFTAFMAHSMANLLILLI